MLHGQNIIGSRLYKSGHKTFKSYNPQNNSPLPTPFYTATETEMEMAIDLAQKAFNFSQNLSSEEKIRFLKEIKGNLLGLGEVLIDTYCNESGLGFKRALNERERTIWQIDVFISQLELGDWVNATIDTPIPNRKPSPKPDLRKMSIPIGPVVIFGSSNFPLAYSTAGGDTISSLAAGCPVIVKSHPMHAGTGELVAMAIQKAAKSTGMPEGIFSNINSNSYKEGTFLVNHPKVKAVGFTGSISGGRAIFDLANKRAEPIPVFAEMGSINPVIVLPEALQKRRNEIADNLANSITLDSGQFCTNPGLIIGIKGADLDAFINQLSELVIAKKPAYMLHPQIAKNYYTNKKVVSSESDEIKENVVTNAADKTIGIPAVAKASGPAFLANKSLHLEVFGPFSLVIECKDENELTKTIANLEGQLTGSIFGESNELVNSKKIISAIQHRVGRLIFNGVPTGVEVCKSMHHGGPYPATTNSQFTAVGHDSIHRWVRPITFQNCPQNLLPNALKDDNPLNILRNIDGEWTKRKIN
jgi:NADP-dependent aldehyde dehydrogenase